MTRTRTMFWLINVAPRWFRITVHISLFWLVAWVCFGCNSSMTEGPIPTSRVITEVTEASETIEKAPEPVEVELLTAEATLDIDNPIYMLDSLDEATICFTALLARTKRAGVVKMESGFTAFAYNQLDDIVLCRLSSENHIETYYNTESPWVYSDTWTDLAEWTEFVEMRRQIERNLGCAPGITTGDFCEGGLQ